MRSCYVLQLWVAADSMVAHTASRGGGHMTELSHQCIDNTDADQSTLANRIRNGVVSNIFHAIHWVENHCRPMNAK